MQKYLLSFFSAFYIYYFFCILGFLKTPDDFLSRLRSLAAQYVRRSQKVNKLYSLFLSSTPRQK